MASLRLLHGLLSRQLRAHIAQRPIPEAARSVARDRSSRVARASTAVGDASQRPRRARQLQSDVWLHGLVPSATQARPPCGRDRRFVGNRQGERREDGRTKHKWWQQQWWQQQWWQPQRLYLGYPPIFVRCRWRPQSPSGEAAGARGGVSGRKFAPLPLESSWLAIAGQRQHADG